MPREADDVARGVGELSDALRAGPPDRKKAFEVLLGKLVEWGDPYLHELADTYEKYLDQYEDGVLVGGARDTGFPRNLPGWSQPDTGGFVEERLFAASVVAFRDLPESATKHLRKLLRCYVRGEGWVPEKRGRLATTGGATWGGAQFSFTSRSPRGPITMKLAPAGQSMRYEVTTSEVSPEARKAMAPWHVSAFWQMTWGDKTGGFVFLDRGTDITIDCADIAIVRDEESGSVDSVGGSGKATMITEMTWATPVGSLTHDVREEDQDVAWMFVFELLSAVLLPDAPREDPSQGEPGGGGKPAE